MSDEKRLKARVAHKHKTEAEWYLDVYTAADSTTKRSDPFIPLDGELIIFDTDESNTKKRFKFGDGKTDVIELPFVTSIKNIIDTGTSGVSQIPDNVADGFDFTEKNPNATELDPSLTGKIAYGATGAFASAFGGKSAAMGKRSHSEGTTTIAKGAYSHAEGDNSVALGNDSHAEGLSTTSAGNQSHAEGSYTVASGVASHAEGTHTTASGNQAHAEGSETTASEFTAHAEGNLTTASAVATHAEGDATVASQRGAHAEGYYTTASGMYSHAEGGSTKASWDYSHAEGEQTTASNYDAHAEGNNTTASAKAAHAEGMFTKASGLVSHAEGYSTIAEKPYAHAEGESSVSKGQASHAEGMSTAEGNYSHSEGNGTLASGRTAHAEGLNTIASGLNSHAEGVNARAIHEASHAEGYYTVSDMAASHAEGHTTVAKGLSNSEPPNGSHIEGGSSTLNVTPYATADDAIADWNTSKYARAFGGQSHVEGFNNLAFGAQAHAEGICNIARGAHSHVEGAENVAAGVNAHAEGYLTTALHDNSHAGGLGNTTSRDNQTVIGQYNADNTDALFIVGNGTHDETNRSNAFVVCENGKSGLLDKDGYGSTYGTWLDSSGFHCRTPEYAMGADEFSIVMSGIHYWDGTNSISGHLAFPSLSGTKDTIATQGWVAQNALYEAISSNNGTLSYHDGGVSHATGFDLNSKRLRLVWDMDCGTEYKDTGIDYCSFNGGVEYVERYSWNFPLGKSGTLALIEDLKNVSGLAAPQATGDFERVPVIKRGTYGLTADEMYYYTISQGAGSNTFAQRTGNGALRGNCTDAILTALANESTTARDQCLINYGYLSAQNYLKATSTGSELPGTMGGLVYRGYNGSLLANYDGDIDYYYSDMYSGEHYGKLVVNIDMLNQATSGFLKSGQNYFYVDGYELGFGYVEDGSVPVVGLGYDYSAYIKVGCDYDSGIADYRFPYVPYYDSDYGEQHNNGTYTLATTNMFSISPKRLATSGNKIQLKAGYKYYITSSGCQIKGVAGNTHADFTDTIKAGIVVCGNAGDTVVGEYVGNPDYFRGFIISISGLSTTSRNIELSESYYIQNTNSAVAWVYVEGPEADSIIVE